MRVPCELDRQLACRRMLLGARSSRASARRRDGGKEQMDFVVGVKGRDFAVVCADAQFTFSVLNQRHQVDKLLELDSHHVMVRACSSIYACNGVQKGALKHDVPASA